MDMDPNFLSGLGKIRIMHKGIKGGIQHARTARHVHFKNQAGIVTDPSIIYLQPRYLPSSPDPPTKSPGLSNCLSSSCVAMWYM